LNSIFEHANQNIATGNAVSNKDGSTSTVKTISVDDGRLNGGKPTLIPTVWNGSIVSDSEAIEFAVSSGKAWPSFPSHDEATKAAKWISNKIRVKQ
jgi:hypothetical protein